MQILKGLTNFKSYFSNLIFSHASVLFDKAIQGLFWVQLETQIDFLFVFKVIFKLQNVKMSGHLEHLDVVSDVFDLSNRFSLLRNYLDNNRLLVKLINTMNYYIIVPTLNWLLFVNIIIITAIFNFTVIKKVFEVFLSFL